VVFQKCLQALLVALERGSSGCALFGVNLTRNEIAS
jgi:hypothetical protein